MGKATLRSRTKGGPKKAAKGGRIQTKGGRSRAGARGSFWRRFALRPIPLAEGCLWLLVLSLWWVHDRSAADAFRMPKLWLGQLLALASVLALAWRLGELPRVGGGAFWRDLWRRPAVAATLPFLLVAASSLVTSAHPLHTRAAFVSLFIAVLALVAWNLGLPRVSQERLLTALVLPAVALGVFAVLQFFGLYQPFQFAEAAVQTRRMGLTSFAGNAGDLAMFLVLPALVGQTQLYRQRGDWRWLWAGVTVLTVGTLALTQTLSALAALAVGSALLWANLLPRRRWLPLAGALLTAGALLVLLLAPLRQRVEQKVTQLAAGKIDVALTGRLDGWRAAWWMFETNPLTGVGHGAYRAEFVPAKLALHDAGVRFPRIGRPAMFLNAHSEPLEVVAELGLPGLLALLWGLGVLGRHLWRSRARGSGEGAWRPALAWGGCAALAVLSLTQFPFRLALVGFPAVLFLSWALRSETVEVPS